jgi:hypothetical protein
VDPRDAVGRDRVRLRRRREAATACSSASRGSGRPTPRAEGAGRLRVVSVLRGTSGDRKFLWDVKQEVGAPPPPRTSQPPVEFRPDAADVSNSQVSTWVPRGFAVVHSDAPGTGLSQGCPTVGGRSESLAPKAVIDWLNGRAKGYTHDRRQRGGRRRLVHRQGRHDRHVLQRHLPLAAATTGVAGSRRSSPSRRTRRTTTTTARTASSAPGRLARRGHRLPLRLRQQRRPGAARVLQPRGTATASSRADATASTATTTTSGRARPAARR